MTGNAIIDLLLSSESDNLRWLLNDAERTFLQPGVKLQSSGALIGHAVFPLSGMATLAWTLEDGSEVTTIGIGTTDSIHAAPDIDLARSTCHARTYLASEVLKIPAGRWQRFLDRNPPARLLLGRYSQYLLARTQQALACNAKHDGESRFCRWLLEIYDRHEHQPFPATHQSLSTLLGVRRTTITLMARSLQEAGIIAYRRGRIAVTDLHALKQASCQCHDLRGGWQDTLREFSCAQAGGPRPRVRLTNQAVNLQLTASGAIGPLLLRDPLTSK